MKAPSLWVLFLTLVGTWTQSTAQTPYGCTRRNDAWTEVDGFPEDPRGYNAERTALTVCRDRCLTEHSATFYFVRRNGEYGTDYQCWCGDELGESGGSCSYRCPNETKSVSGKPCGGTNDAYSAYRVCSANSYGQDCTSRCPNCAKDICLLMDGNCLRECKSGWHGDRCNLECPPKCLNNRCDQQSGDCTDGCNNGWYGTNCRQRCGNCAGNKNRCDQTTGECNGACDVNWYGVKCDMKCGNCATDRCDQTTAECDGECESGFYTPQCNKSCPKKCGASCTQGAGDCEECKGGWYGAQCNLKCPANCLAQTCQQESGQCDNGCQDGWYWTKCDVSCGKCAGDKCDQTTGVCEGGCDPGWYTPQCSVSCPENCLGNSCATNGSCSGCDEGWYGSMCTETCPDNCNNPCSQESGNCEVCKDGWYGNKCDMECGQCADGKCDRTTGQCAGSCEIGFHGPRCVLSCPDSCASQETCKDTSSTPVLLWPVVAISIVANLTLTAVVVWLRIIIKKNQRCHSRWCHITPCCRWSFSG